MAPLRALLTKIGDDVAGNPLVPFARLTSAHFLSWFIVDRANVGPYLICELNVDGPVEPFLFDLVAQARPGLDQIYAHCPDYPADGQPAQIVEYLRRGDIGHDCYYVGWPGLTVDRILKERDLRRRLEDFLDQQDEAALGSPSAIRQKLQDYVERDSSLHWARTVPLRPFLVRNRTQVLAAINVAGVLIGLGILGLGFLVAKRHGIWPDVIAVGAVAAIIGIFLAVLRWLEVTDSVSDAQPDHSQVQVVANQENRVVQNHLASVADVKPGEFRQLLLKGVLKFIQILATVSANQGNLSGITSIHFARWVVINDGKQLLFLSNYDGSWENYLDDFIDRASAGLTAIWSNTVGFPRTEFLVNGGATDELLFKTLTRQSQEPSLVWYTRLSRPEQAKHRHQRRHPRGPVRDHGRGRRAEMAEEFLNL